MTVPNQKATANYASSRGNTGGKRYPELLGVKARAGGFLSLMKAHGSTVEGHWKLGDLSAEEESGIPCSGEMRRDMEEHQWRRRLSGL